MAVFTNFLRALSIFAVWTARRMSTSGARAQPEPIMTNCGSLRYATAKYRSPSDLKEMRKVSSSSSRVAKSPSASSARSMARIACSLTLLSSHEILDELVRRSFALATVEDALHRDRTCLVENADDPPH